MSGLGGILKDVTCVINGILLILPINSPLARLCPAPSATKSGTKTSLVPNTSLSATATISVGSSSSPVVITPSTTPASTSSSSSALSTSITVVSTSTSVSSSTSRSTGSSASTSTLVLPSSLSATSSTTASTPPAATYNAFTCPAGLPLSCQNTTAVENTCCFEAPGGLILQTQFWDTDPVTGPANSWTIHGLWPDNCDGTYEATCDLTRQYTNITQILQAKGRQDLVDYMNTYWVSNSGTAESFWEHEWGKHGTCMSTFDTECYSNYQVGDEIPDFFDRTVDTFKTLPTYDWLAAAGITPSCNTTYTTAQIQSALGAHFDDRSIYLGCYNGAIDEVWYYYNVQGSVQTGTFFPVDQSGSNSCPSTGIKYLPKDGSCATTTTSTSATASPTATGSPTPFVGSGHLYVYQSSGAQSGFVISDGSWYNTGGTPATYRTNTTTGDGPFTLSSSKGLCAVASDASFSCGASVTTGSSFFNDNGVLQYADSDDFGAAAVPSGQTHGQLFASSSQPVSVTLHWVGK